MSKKSTYHCRCDLPASSTLYPAAKWSPLAKSAGVTTVETTSGSVFPEVEINGGECVADARRKFSEYDIF
jgi:hypothetical protein